MRRASIHGVAIAALIVLAGSFAAAALDDPFNLAIGDPGRKGRTAALSLDGVTDTATGDALTPRQLAARLASTRVLFVGESHTNIETHRAQLRIIQELQRTGRRVLIGLEMYAYTDQSWLDQWIDGLLTEEGFLKLSHWYKSWGYNWNYYRDIFLFAREHRLRMVAVNTPREVVSAVRKKGFANLTAEEAAHIPSRVDVDNAEHKQLFRAFFEDEGGAHSSMTDEQMTGMFNAQCTWDATMGYNAVQALKAANDPGAIIVVLIGSGHVAYGLGAERQARLWFDGPMATLVPIALTTDNGAPRVVRASYADYLWGIPAEDSPLYPDLGASLRESRSGEPLEVIDVEADSIAAAADLKVGDRLLTMDGEPLKDIETFHRLMAGKRWADEVVLEARRGDRTLTLTVPLRRRAGS